MNRGDAIERIVALLNEAMLDDARWPETSAVIDEAFGAKGNTVAFGDEPTKGDLQIFFTKCYYRGVDRSAWLQEYFRDYYAQDEHLPQLQKLPDGKIVPVADLFSEQELKTSRLYNEALLRFDNQNGLHVGRTLRQIAATTGRRYSTVRTHLKHVFTKLGVTRQFEVAQRVLALSSLPARPGLETPAARARAASRVPLQSKRLSPDPRRSFLGAAVVRHGLAGHPSRKGPCVVRAPTPMKPK